MLAVEGPRANVAGKKEQGITCRADCRVEKSKDGLVHVDFLNCDPEEEPLDISSACPLLLRESPGSIK